MINEIIHDTRLHLIKRSFCFDIDGNLIKEVKI